jgi:hypothetical protein
MMNFLLEKMDKIKSDRETYCARQALILYELYRDGKDMNNSFHIELFKYNFFCKNTRKS